MSASTLQAVVPSIRQLRRWTLLLFACGSGMFPAFAQSPQEQWQEEILLQFSELRRSQGELARQVADLKVDIETLRAGAGRKVGAVLSLDLRNVRSPALGDIDAPIALVEFSDFECPYCGRHRRRTLPGLMEKYVDSGKVKYIFIDFPLGFHSRAEPASIAAACADRQGAFWKMHGLLFDNQKALGEQTFLKLASDLKLDGDEFKHCLQDPKIAAQLRSQVALGESLGVQGTPAFLIGRVRDGVLTDAKVVSGAQPQANFERIIDLLLVGTE